MSRDEYKEMLKNNNSWQTRAIRSDHTETKVLRQTVAEIQRILPHCKDFLFPHHFRLEVCIVGYGRGDVDNVGKGILDALQGTAYGNDRDCNDFRVYRGHD